MVPKTKPKTKPKPNPVGFIRTFAARVVDGRLSRVEITAPPGKVAARGMSP
jgi:hypothetical protein